MASAKGYSGGTRKSSSSTSKSTSTSTSKSTNTTSSALPSDFHAQVRGLVNNAVKGGKVDHAAIKTFVDSIRGSASSTAKKTPSPVQQKIAAAKKQNATMRALGMPLGTQIYRNRKPYPAQAQARMERAAARRQTKKK